MLPDASPSIVKILIILRVDQAYWCPKWQLKMEKVMGFGTRFICWLVPRVLVAVCCGCLHPYIPNFNLVLAGNFYSTFFYAYQKALICLLGCILGIKHQIMILLLEALYLSKFFPLWLVQGFVQFRWLAKRTSCLASEKEKMEISQKSQSPSSWIYIDSTWR